MSRRHASTHLSVPGRLLVAGLALLMAGVLQPAVTTAQDGESIRPRDVQREWQLLTQRDEDGNLEDVLPGVGATMQLRSGAAFGDGACSSYDSTFSLNANRLDVFIEDDQIDWRDCDPLSRSFDEQFYDNLRQIASIERADEVLIVRDEVEQPLMTFTRSQIERDPTASRWTLARIGDADGAVEPVIQGLEPWIEFLVGGSVVGETGCGSFLGKYTTNEGRIDITDVHYRLANCIGGAGAQAERILSTLSQITDFEVRPAGLALEDENGVIRLALEPELDVGGRLWTPTAVYDANGGLLFGGSELTTSAIQFLSGRYEGTSICRPFFGTVLRSGLAVSIVGRPTFEENKRLERLCGKRKVDGVRLDQIEEAFITALEDAASYALRGDELTLNDVDGVARAVLEPQPPLTGTTWTVDRMRIGKKQAAPKTDVPITAIFTDPAAITIGTVTGDTGVSNSRGTNEYYGTYITPGATRIEVANLDLTGAGCDRPREQKTQACKMQKRFLQLLQQADSYIVREGEVWFRRNQTTTIRLLELPEE